MAKNFGLVVVGGRPGDIVASTISTYVQGGVFHELLSLGCINFKNLCGHHQEEVLRFPKHPQLVKFG